MEFCIFEIYLPIPSFFALSASGMVLNRSIFEYPSVTNTAMLSTPVLSPRPEVNSSLLITPKAACVLVLPRFGKKLKALRTSCFALKETDESGILRFCLPSDGSL